MPVHLQVDKGFIETTVKRAVEKQVDVEIRKQVREVVHTLWIEMFGRAKPRKWRVSKDRGKRTVDFTKLVKESLEAALAVWIKRAMAEEVGGDLIQYVVDTVRVDLYEYEDDEEDDADEGDPL